MVCLAAPWVTRALLLGEKRLGFGFVDLRGFVADASVALAVLGVLGLLIATRRGVGRFLAWCIAAAFVIATFAIYELVAVFDSFHALSHAHFLGDPTFLGGSVRHVRRPWLVASTLLAVSLGIAWARAPGRSWWAWWAGAFVLSVFGHALLPLSHYYDGWRQRHAVHAFVSALPTRAHLGVGTVAGEVRDAFEADLRGTRRLEPLEGRPNVILILVEAASGASLPSVAASAGVETTAPMPKLDALAEKHLLFTQVVSHQRQTNRGEYAILCGDYPKLLTDQSKMTEQVYGPARRCLPAVLRDAGYATAYIQAAPLGFMLKDQFMKKAGFDELIGDSWFERSYARTDWGVDDKAFFEQALPKVVELHQREEPFFATMLTVGTHHPFTIPDAKVAEGAVDRRARAFRWADDALSDFLSELDLRGVLEDTLVVITSDESAGLVDTLSSTQRLLAQSWSFAVVMLPTPRSDRIDTLYAHVDTALSVTDLLDIDTADFVGRSWFREYASARPLFAGNTYARKVIMWKPSGDPVVCDESFRECKRYRRGRDSELTIRDRGQPATARDRRILAEVARLTRSGRDDLSKAASLTLFTADEVKARVSEGKKLLAGGQYLRVPGGTVLDVRLDLQVERGEVELHHDVFLDGHEKFARKRTRLVDGQRWRLHYELGVPEDSSQLVVQLYATAIAGEEATIHVHTAELGMRHRRNVSEEILVIGDAVSPTPSP